MYYVIMDLLSVGRSCRVSYVINLYCVLYNGKRPVKSIFGVGVVI